jgi:hypothetical protein
MSEGESHGQPSTSIALTGRHGHEVEVDIARRAPMAQRSSLGSFIVSVIATYALVLFVHFAAIVFVGAAIMLLSGPIEPIAFAVAGWGAGLAGVWLTFLSCPGWALHALVLAIVVRLSRRGTSRASAVPEMVLGFVVAAMAVVLAYAVFRHGDTAASKEWWKVGVIAIAEGALGATAARLLCRARRAPAR